MAMPDRTLRSRPMATQQTESDGAPWFFTQASAAKADEIWANSHVNVSYASPPDKPLRLCLGHGHAGPRPQEDRGAWIRIQRIPSPTGCVSRGPDEDRQVTAQVEV